MQALTGAYHTQVHLTTNAALYSLLLFRQLSRQSLLIAAMDTTPSAIQNHLTPSMCKPLPEGAAASRAKFEAKMKKSQTRNKFKYDRRFRKVPFLNRDNMCS